MEKPSKDLTIAQHISGLNDRYLELAAKCWLSLGVLTALPASIVRTGVVDVIMASGDWEMSRHLLIS